MFRAFPYFFAQKTDGIKPSAIIIVFEYTIVGANSVRPFPVSFYVTHISPIPIFSVKASILNSHCDMLFVYDLCIVHIRNSSCDFKYAVIGSC